MINVEEWFMIRELARQGLSITDIAQRLGCDRKTVRKYLLHPDQPRYAARPPQASKLDPFKSYVQQRLETGVFNCEVLYRELCARGYDGKKTILRDWSCTPLQRIIRDGCNPVKSSYFTTVRRGICDGSEPVILPTPVGCSRVDLFPHSCLVA
jgi:hypothetical protein